MHEKSGHIAFARALGQLAALADDAHITRVAARTHVSQSAARVQATLSRSIRRWEKELSIPLLEADGRGIRLTADARELAAAAEQAIDIFDATVDRLRRRNAFSSLTLGLLTSLGPTVVGDLVMSFMTRMPDAAIAHREGSSAGLLRGLDNGSLDVAVMAPQPDPPYEWLALGRQALSLIVPVGHPLAQRGPVRLVHAADERFLALDRRFDARRRADRLWEAAGFSPNIVLEADDVRSVRSYVGSGLGIAILPADNVVDTRTVSVAIDSPDAVREFGLVWREENENVATRALIDHSRHLNDLYPGWADITS